MQLLDLPVELFELILRDAMIARGLKRALRLRLVNKTFAKAVWGALYTFELLESLLEHYYDGYDPFSKGVEIDPREVPLSLRVPYLAHRVLHEPSKGNQILVWIRQAAIEMCKSDDPGMVKLSSVGDYVHMLCSSMDGYYTPDDIERRYETCPKSRYERTARFIDVFRKTNSGDAANVHYGSYLYAAAIRLNCLSIIQDCIDEDPQLLDTTIRCRYGANLILGDCYILAGQYASTDVLEYFLTAGATTLNSHFRRFLLMVAAQAGRSHIASYLYHFKLDLFPWDFGDSRNDWWTGTAWLRGTSDLDTIKFAATLSPEPCPPLKEWVLAYTLQEASSDGRLDTVTYLLQHNVPAVGHGRFIFKNCFSWMGLEHRKIWSRTHESENHPIRIAAKKGHTSIVDLLLQHGASAPVAMSNAARWGQGHVLETLLNAYPASEDAVLESAMGGFTTIAQMLLDKGADANGGLKRRVASVEGSTAKEKSPLVYAIEKENKTLFELLLQHGARLDLLGTADECIQLAKDEGLESMLALILTHLEH